MSKPGGDPSSGISSGEPWSLPERHPACRRREAQPGSCTERENLSLRCQGRRQAAHTARTRVPKRSTGRRSSY